MKSALKSPYKEPAMAVSPIPEGYHSVTPYLIIKNAAAALDFYVRALGAIELFRIEGPGKSVGHAEIKIGNSILMFSDEHPDLGFKSPTSYGGSPVGFMVYVPDVDAQFQKALDAGAKAIRPIANQFYGDRNGIIEDPFGHQWTLSTHVEDVPPEEMNRRAEEWAKQ